jgi:hypothetical protein
MEEIKGYNLFRNLRIGRTTFRNAENFERSIWKLNTVSFTQKIWNNRVIRKFCNFRITFENIK